MARRISVVIGLVLAFIVAGLLITALQKGRLDANMDASRNNLRQLAFFAAHHSNPNPGPDAKPPFRIDVPKLPSEIPAATAVLPGVRVEERLSWVVRVLPALDQKRHPVEQLLTQIQFDQPWPAEPNQLAGRTRLAVMLCPENTPLVPPGSPAMTSYVGIAGIGPDAATIALPQGLPTPPRAGAFRFDAATPFDRITDGLSQTLLMGETADSPGPWLQGGRSTTRGLDDSAGAKPFIGTGGQFGGYFPHSTNFAICDGSVRTFTHRVTPAVLLKLATIAGGPADGIVEE